jgi:hypothetical protein
MDFFVSYRKMKNDFLFLFHSFSLSTLPCVLYIFIEGVWRVLHTSCGWRDFYRGFVGEKRSGDKSHHGDVAKNPKKNKEPVPGVKEPDRNHVRDLE